RRHTRSKRDWSSDVCSSDLGRGERDVLDGGYAAPHEDRAIGAGDDVAVAFDDVEVVGEPDRHADEAGLQVIEGGHLRSGIVGVEIGRASCREEWRDGWSAGR